MKKLFVYLLIAGCNGSAIAQGSIVQDTSFITAAVKNSVHYYDRVIKGQSQLYNGSDYFDYQSLKEEHPYFLSDDWLFGSVIYDGNFYDSVPLLYDISKDEIVTETYYSHSMMKLIKERVTGFTLPERTFTALSNADVPKGFYEILYDGKTKVYARHIKLFQESIQSQEIIHTFEEKTRYYILKDGVYHFVKSKKSVLQVFADRKRDVIQAVGKEKIRFKQNREKYIILMAKAYDLPHD